MNSKLPTLPQSLLDTIGEYGMARTDRVSPLEVQHRWELLIAGIKDYAASVATQPPQDERGQELSHEFAVRLSEYGVSMAHRQAEKARVLAEVLQSMFDASAPAQQAAPNSELLGIVRTAMAQANVIIKADGDKGDRSQAMLDLPLTVRVIETAIATPPQPVAAEGLTGDSLIRNAQALLNLDADGALVPHGIGGHARKIIQAFINQEAMK